jgi:hypothetical protein
MQVRYDEEALVFILQADAVGQGAYIVAQVQFAGGAVACEYSFAFHDVLRFWP